ncbi:hypothetical protein GUJ93_ZPchr0003g17243 [Zizania palustris]|uniref:Uncharacterized protein n=1 Tax=Zizania palustris TaxID=103762 RepID=A0A8J5RNV8_ZIZPA|nr:hypothetical protein GUJ93_ZPchr0003g16983 [Zizania palustris]KAG8062075.1 hypothetical protein GUJ93_ZPchr0003g17243 [Zizania palustris]
MASVAELKEKHSTAMASVSSLRERLRQRREILLDTDVQRYSKAQGRAPVSFNPTDLVCCRTLQGHSGKVYSLDWTPEKNWIVSASQDGRLIVWNALTSQKTHAIKLHCPWVMTCAFAPNGQSVACGGLDNACSIFNLNSQADRDGNIPVSRILTGHKGYVSSCQIASRAVRTYHGHESDINSVKFFPDGQRFGTGSDDGTCRLFDMRTGHQLQVYSREPDRSDNELPTVTSIAFSISGRLLFAGYSNGDCYVWDTLLAEVVLNLGTLQNSHEGRISCLGLSSDGSALCTGSYDKNLKIWAFSGHRKIV